MSVIHSLLHESVRIGRTFDKSRSESAVASQQKILANLINKAKHTEFGKHYRFKELLKSNHLADDFREAVPLHDYNQMFTDWWYRTLNDQPNITWPESVKYFGLTSGSSQAASKRIPLTESFIKSTIRTATKQFFTISDYPLPKSFYGKGILMVGGTTQLQSHKAHFEGDLSGILARNIPAWAQRMSRPGPLISSQPDWETRLELMIESAPKWDIGIISGIPAWIQLLCQGILDRHKVDTIQDLWPNLRFLVHGGTAFGPYQKWFDETLGHNVNYQETYLATEGFIAYKNGLRSAGMQLIADSNIFYEFIPYEPSQFPFNLANGGLKSVLLQDVQENQEYALVLSSNSGAWRYLIGDVVRFTNVVNLEIEITGRIHQHINLCGEHLSVYNMNEAIQHVAAELNIKITEYTAHGYTKGGEHGHHWFIGTNDIVQPNTLAALLDRKLASLNDDYSVERRFALKHLDVHVLKPEIFYKWMAAEGRIGGQQKFPRVLDGNRQLSWNRFLKEHRLLRDVG